VVLDEFLQHLRPAAELVGLHVGLEQVRQHQVAGGAVLLQRLEEHLAVVGLLAGGLEGGVEDFFLDRGVGLDLGGDLLQQFGAGLLRTVGGVCQLGERMAQRKAELT
jgi:hypothetical protein